MESLDGFAPIEGRFVYYRFTHFYEEGPVIVFLHDALGSVAQWKDFPDKISGILGVSGLVYDRHGHGKSEPSPFGARTTTYLEDEAVVCFRALVEQLVPKRKLILVGHSDGGSIALIASAILPDYVIGTVSIAGHVFLEGVAHQGISQMKEIYETTDMRQKLSLFHGGKTDSLFYAWANTWLSPPFRDWSITHWLPDIACPVLVIQGAEDEYATVDHVAAIMNGIQGPSQSWIVPNCGHVPQKHHSAETISAIVTFYHECLPLFHDVESTN